MNKQTTRTAIDGCMIIILPLLMSYSLIGKANHIYLGLLMFTLFVCHHALNRRWLLTLFKGRYTLQRTVSTAVNMALILVMFAMPVSGLIIDRQVVPALHIAGSAASARLVHLPASYWGFMLMTFHLGLQWQRILGLIKARMNKPVLSAKLSNILRLFILIISACGIRAFIKRDMWSYMSLQSQFVFIDTKEPLLLFLADFTAVMIASAAAAYYLNRVLGKLQRLKK